MTIRYVVNSKILYFFIYALSHHAWAMEDLELKSPCTVCLERESIMVTLPCQHVCLCKECGQAIRKANNICVMCRADIGQMVELSHFGLQSMEGHYLAILPKLPPAKAMEQNEEIMDARVELAMRMVGHNKLHEQSLRCFFEGIVKALNEKFKDQIGDNLKEEIWNRVSPQRIEVLHKLFFRSVGDKIFAQFNDEEIASMLKEHKEINRVMNPSLSARLQTTMFFNKTIIQNIVCEHAQAQSDLLIADIIREAFSKD